LKIYFLDTSHVYIVMVSPACELTLKSSYVHSLKPTLD